MSTIKLTYFDVDGGRAEPTRIALSIGGIEFEDHRISFSEFGQMRSSTPFNALPAIEMNDGVYTQSNAMNRYFGKQAGLYPEDPWQAFLCDEVMDAGDELKAAREKLVDGAFTTYLKTLNARLEAAGGEYFADGRLTVADLKVFVWIRGLNSGVLDYVPTGLAARVAPLLVQHMERVAADPGVAAYYEGRGK